LLMIQRLVVLLRGHGGLLVQVMEGVTATATSARLASIVVLCERRP
jgi:hypothetical protein